MSYNQKPPGSSGSGMGAGPPNGPNNMPQVAKTFAGIQQQMQNLVHGQNAIPQSSQADINVFLQQQRIQNMLKQQQQFLQFQQQMQQQQHQQQQHQHHNMVGGGGVGPGPVGGVPVVGGVAGPSGGGAGGSGEPLALTRTAGAAELLNKTYQQQANGNPAANPAFNQLQQTLQALPTNFVQQLQVIQQYQMQAKQMQQQQHGGGQGQHGHGQQQPVQGVPAPLTTPSVMSHQQQQQQQQKHQNQQQQQQQQQQNALSRYLTAAAAQAQATAASGNKMSSATPPPPPPLTNQMKPPNLPPNTQITPVTAANIAGGNISGGPNPKTSTGNANTGSSKHPAPPPSISLTPSKSTTSGPSIAHQQNKFTPPLNSGAKGGHMSHLQNLPKSTHGATHTATATSNTTSPAKTSTTNTDVTVAPLKSPQSTPVQLTKQIPPTATTPASATTTTGATSSMVSPLKSTTAVSPIAANISVTSASDGPAITTTTTSTTTVEVSVTPTKASSSVATKSASSENTATKPPLKSVNAEKENAKTSLSGKISTPASDSTAASHADDTKKETEKQKGKEKKVESINKSAPAPAPAALTAEVKGSLEKSGGNGLKSTPVTTTTSDTKSTDAISPVESKDVEEKLETSTKIKKAENHDVKENEKKLSNAKKAAEKIETTITDEKKNSKPSPISGQETATHLGAAPNLQSDEKKPTTDFKQIKNTLEEKKLESKEKVTEKEKDKTIKSNKPSTKIQQLETVASKEVQKKETEAEKPVTCVETKAPSTIIPQTIPVKSSEKDEANVKNSLEATSNKKNTSETGKNKEEKKLPATSVCEPEVTKASKSSTPTENKKEKEVSKENDESLKPNELIEISETTTSVNKSKIEDAVKAIPAKKAGRLPKGAKNKSVASATPTNSKTKVLKEDKPTASNARVKRKPKADNSHVSDLAPSTPKDEDADRKSKRHRLKTILYQSPLPELAYITKLSASEASNSPKPMSNEDRLIVFYKNEYMAVRNAEGTFYLCQTMQNVYRTSPRISIRWLSEDDKDNNVFIPDFYDHTDIECVLTTVELKRIDKGHLRLPTDERNRIESILKKAIDVEKGLVPRPELTEENPDGLDISLFKDESQIEKKSALMDGSENQTFSFTPGRKSRRGNTTSASSGRKSNVGSGTPSTSARNKRKSNATTAATSSSKSRKSLTKKRKTLVRRRKMLDNSDDEDDDDETSDDCESDAEYIPTQKRSSLSGASKTAPRAQRSPLAKARAASPITPTTSRSKNVPRKITPTPSTSSKATRGERAAKRKSITDVNSIEEAPTAAKKPTTTSSNNKSKASDTHTIEATPVKKSSLIDNSSASS